MFILMKPPITGRRLSPIQVVFEKQRNREVIGLALGAADAAIKKGDEEQAELLLQMVDDVTAQQKELIERTANDAEVQQFEKIFLARINESQSGT